MYRLPSWQTPASLTSVSSSPTRRRTFSQRMTVGQTQRPSSAVRSFSPTGVTR